MDKHVLIVDKALTKSLEKVNESKNSETANKFLLNGIFTEFDVENRNNRIYTAENFLPVMEKLIEKKNKLGVLFGEFDHPDVFDITGKNISHAIEDMRYNESENRIDGTIALLSTSWGKEARAIINDGYPLFVSSRAAGVTDANGNVALKELFTYDAVVDPGFSSARVSLNESMGYSATDDVPYRIYEMADGDVNKLFNDNKNDQKTNFDLKEMHTMLQNEAVKIEQQIMSKIKTDSPENVQKLLEKYDTINDELSNVNEYLEFLKSKISYLVTENSKLKTTNSELKEELNENTLYSNHLATSVKSLNKSYNEISKRLSVDEKFMEHIAENAEATIEFTEHVAKHVETANEQLKIQGSFMNYIAEENSVTQKFAENNAKELDITQKFVENNAKELDITQKFTENNAKELDITQKFTESVANETSAAQGFINYVAEEVQNEDIFLNYIAEKVDGLVGYNRKIVESIKNTNVVVNESAKDDENSIYNIDNIDEYLGLDEEQEIVNNIKEEFEDDDNIDNVETSEIDNTETEETETEETEETETDIDDVEQTVVDNVEETEEIIEPEGEDIENALLSKLVSILGTDETGIIIEITDDNKVIIQKSGSDETVSLGMEDEEFEIIDTENNITETVENVLAEIKKQKVLANEQPHFFNFLSEQQISDFKNLDKETQDAVVLAMNESEYFDSNDVLGVIKNVLNERSMSYEERLVSNIPTEIKESWNELPKNQKMSILTESKYFNLITSSDIENFWKTQPFAKTKNEAKLIKESLEIKEDEEFSDEFVDAFLEKMGVNNR